MTPLNTILKGDVLEVLKTLDSDSVDCLITSPPYWALRNYGVEGQLGLEKSPREYVEHLLTIFDEVKRVVKPTGTVWVNLGDTYSTSKVGNTNGTTGNVLQKEGVNDMKFVKKTNYPAKTLLAIPDRFKIGMVDRGWICANDIIWYKRNAMPQSAKGRFSVDYERIFFFVKNTDPLYYINGRANPNFRLTKPTYAQGQEGIDWQWKIVSEKKKKKFIASGKPMPMNWRLDSSGTYYQKYTLWEGVDYYFKTQYRPLAESTLKEIQKAYNGKSRKNYKDANAQDASDSKRSMVRSLQAQAFNIEPIEQIADSMGIDTGIKFGGNKAEGYGNPTYSGKPWVPAIIKEVTIDTRPGRDTGNGKSGTPEDPNAGPHNADISTKRQTTVREINGELFGGLRRSVWDITTRGYPGAHFATFPEPLVEQMIKPGCPEWVCVKCGVPRFPIMESSPEYAKLLGKGWHDHKEDDAKGQMQDKNLSSARADYRVVGLSDCGCNAGFKPGLVLDPFSGAATVALVALKLGFNFLGIELKQEYIDQSVKRLQDNGFNYPS